jgi:hypothetical protein
VPALSAHSTRGRLSRVKGWGLAGSRSSTGATGYHLHIMCCMSHLASAPVIYNRLHPRNMAFCQDTQEPCSQSAGWQIPVIATCRLVVAQFLATASKLACCTGTKPIGLPCEIFCCLCCALLNTHCWYQFSGLAGSCPGSVTVLSDASAVAVSSTAVLAVRHGCRRMTFCWSAAGAWTRATRRALCTQAAMSLRLLATRAGALSARMARQLCRIRCW